MNKSFLLFSALFGLSAAGSSGSVCSYEVTVSNARDLPDEDQDWFWTKNYNDVYVEVIGYAVDSGDDKIRVLRTRTIDESETPEWNEKFLFIDDQPECGADGWDKFLFKLYDDDSIGGSTLWGAANPDFLGETKYISSSELVDCDKIYAFELAVSRDNQEAGTLFVEISKLGCCSTTSNDYQDTKDYKELEEELEKEIEKEEELKEEIKKEEEKYEEEKYEEEKYEEEEEKVKGSGKTKRRLLSHA